MNEKLTIEYLQWRVFQISEHRHDNEAVHNMEDQLRDDFIRSLITFDYTQEEIKKFSSLVLSTNVIEFERWGA